MKTSKPTASIEQAPNNQTQNSFFPEWMSETAKKAVMAYGGPEIWLNAKKIEAEVSVRGLAFLLKQRPYFKHARINMQVQQPVSSICPIGKHEELTGELNGPNVSLLNSKGELVSSRKDARSKFSSLRRWLYWDDEDMAYFANYAFWNYFTLPRLLMNSNIKWTEKAPGNLLAEFPDTIPSHSKIQEFYFDKETGLLNQHNYRVDIISKLANAAHAIQSNESNNSIPFPNSRKVTPMKSTGKPSNGPTLIHIVVHSFRIN